MQSKKNRRHKGNTAVVDAPELGLPAVQKSTSGSRKDTHQKPMLLGEKSPGRRENDLKCVIISACVPAYVHHNKPGNDPPGPHPDLTRTLHLVLGGQSGDGDDELKAELTKHVDTFKVVEVGLKSSKEEASARLEGKGSGSLNRLKIGGKVQG